MAEILGLGCSHGPIILTPPEVWSKGRERLFARVPNYEPPPQLLEELGDDNGLSQDRADHEHVVASFAVMRSEIAWTSFIGLLRHPKFNLLERTFSEFVPARFGVPLIPFLQKPTPSILLSRPWLGPHRIRVSAVNQRIQRACQAAAL